mmetsp:Transcript_12534/g.24914  ORF Transcript_12534/g.24914 Transcript_12534/m.24914 type:complete len:248 (+) Transcript_12534:212-955(+)|eukprot:CAMPEP_0182459820 /NCGR_PEP_ID=MMETSP1319-20130603/4857_1 /TAXON_ID=172717 /ORGANISM="Bolidomonas pacifica, Strain RCC208" /LENGTH=247 /DNA_ID=CAMNT_0024658821 /DNA_START=190 /DNA_END=933 /DNA_ORIENTATION=+
MGNLLGLSRSAAREPEQLFEDPEDAPYLYCMRSPEILDWKNGLSASEIQAVAREQRSLPCCVIPSLLYLSDHGTARDLPLLSSLGITHVFHVAGKFQTLSPTVDYASAGIKQVERDAEDEEGYPMLHNHFEAFEAFVRDARETNEHAKVLIHCVAGLNRSGVLAAALLMRLTSRPVLSCVSTLRRSRGNHALSNESFQRELVEMARRGGTLGDPEGAALRGGGMEGLVRRKERERKAAGAIKRLAGD